MSAGFLFVHHLSQLGLGAWSLSQSYKAIVRLRSYEDLSEKAAKYSDTAAHQLHKTRTTQGSAAFTILLSLVTSAYLAYSTGNRSSSINTLIMNGINLGTTAFAQIHVANFWQSKAKVPGVEGFSKAVEQTKTVKQLLKYLSWSWALTTIVTVVDYAWSE